MPTVNSRPSRFIFHLSQMIYHSQMFLPPTDYSDHSDFFFSYSMRSLATQEIALQIHTDFYSLRECFFKSRKDDILQAGVQTPDKRITHNNKPRKGDRVLIINQILLIIFYTIRIQKHFIFLLGISLRMMLLLTTNIIYRFILQCRTHRKRAIPFLPFKLLISNIFCFYPFAII